MKFVREAVERTREECEFLMQARRWNCSSIHKAPKFMNDLKRGTSKTDIEYYAISYILIIVICAVLNCANERNESLQFVKMKFGVVRHTCKFT